jgi:hypothetical protein
MVDKKAPQPGPAQPSAQGPEASPGSSKFTWKPGDVTITPAKEGSVASRDSSPGGAGKPGSSPAKPGADSGSDGKRSS